ncbi:MAG: glycoside hydrolase family 3 protein [Calothrix sp. SM1_5_4]|nr:glycoside hydrolase family 3 protein [Calothrix sp. SM1_5_4]
MSEMTLAYSKGLNAGGVLPTAKHFPGHGGTSQDSHQTTPRKMSSLEELQKRDFVPFEKFTEVIFPRAIMMAHLSLPKIDASGVPATYSSTIIKNQLRDVIGYDGLVITDDLEMSGAAIKGDIGERAIKAFLAGNDMLMLAGSPRNQRKAFLDMVKAVHSGRIPLSRLNESVTRILEAKSQYSLEPVKLDEKKVLTAFKKINTLSLEVLKRNFKVASAVAHRGWPEVTGSTRVTVFSASGLFHQNSRRRLRDARSSIISRRTRLTG